MIISILNDNELRVNSENFKQMSGEQLCEAAKQGQKEAVTQLIRSGVDVNATDSEGRTALHWSVERTKFAVVKELLDLSARIDMLDGRSESPVHIAVRNCQGPSDTIGKMMVNVLLQRYTGPKRQLVDLQSATGDTCVHIAVRAGNETVLQALVKHRPNLELPNNANETPRSLAASQSPAIQQLVRVSCRRRFVSSVIYVFRLFRQLSIVFFVATKTMFFLLRIFFRFFCFFFSWVFFGLVYSIFCD